MINVVITGKDSYIGTQFIKHVENRAEYNVQEIDLHFDKWQGYSFKGVDVVIHLAAIVHVKAGVIAEKEYLKVNRDLAIEVAKKAKMDGVKQFVFMSTMGVYGGCYKLGEDAIIYDSTAPNPITAYAKSKLAAEHELNNIKSEHFKVAVLRPPMVYGPNAIGNYASLAKLAKLTPIFPQNTGERSMIFVGNLCEFIMLVIDNEEEGTFFPQNKSYVNVTDMVLCVAKAHNRRIMTMSGFNSLIGLISSHSNLFNKVFGTLVYAKSLSKYKFDYNIYDFHSSINISELGE